MLWGAPGVGKSQSVREIAKIIEERTDKKVNIVDVRLLLFNPIDLRGIPILNTIKELCNMGDDNIKIENQKLFDNNADNFKSYLAMKNCKNDIKTGVLNEIFEGIIVGAIDEIKKKYPLHSIKTDEIYDDNRDNEIKALCSGDRIGDKLLGFAIICNKKYRNDEICVGIEVNKNGIYYEIYLKDCKARSASKNVEIARTINQEGNSDGTWIWWEWCKFGPNDKVDFCNPNDSFAELINKDNRAKFIKTIIEVIVNLHKTIEKKKIV